MSSFNIFKIFKFRNMEILNLKTGKLQNVKISKSGHFKISKLENIKIQLKRNRIASCADKAIRICRNGLDWVGNKRTFDFVVDSMFSGEIISGNTDNARFLFFYLRCSFWVDDGSPASQGGTVFRLSEAIQTL